MGKDPAEIRQEISETRGELGETMEAIGYKTDVKARAGDFVNEKKEAVTSKVGEVLPSREGVQKGARRVGETAKNNPLGIAIGAAATGFLVGMLIPSTRLEDERLGEMADDVKDKAKETGQEALERGKQVAQEATEQVVETVKERGSEEGQAVASSLQSKAGDVIADQRSESPA